VRKKFLHHFEEKLNATKRSTTWHVSTSSKVMQFVFLFFLLSQYAHNRYLFNNAIVDGMTLFCDDERMTSCAWVDLSHFDFLSSARMDIFVPYWINLIYTCWNKKAVSLLKIYIVRFSRWISKKSKKFLIDYFFNLLFIRKV
jgi:hypothetical protein